MIDNFLPIAKAESLPLYRMVLKLAYVKYAEHLSVCVCVCVCARARARTCARVCVMDCTPGPDGPEIAWFLVLGVGIGAGRTLRWFF